MQTLLTTLKSQQARWRAGGGGEARVVEVLLDVGQAGWWVLADRRWPGTSKANLDVVVVGPGGVFVIDAKNWRDVRVEAGSLWHGKVRQDEALDKLRDQAAAVEELPHRADAGRQADGGEESCTRRANAGVLRLQAALGGRNVGPCQQDFGRQARRHLRHAGYRKEPIKGKLLLKVAYRKYPNVVKAMIDRSYKYNQALDELVRLEAEGKVFVIRPEQPIAVSRLENNPENLAKAYEVAIRETELILPKLRSWLDGE